MEENINYAEGCWNGERNRGVYVCMHGEIAEIQFPSMSDGPLWLTAINPSMSGVWSREFQLQHREHRGMLGDVWRPEVQSHDMSKIHSVKKTQLFCVKVNMKCCSQPILFPLYEVSLKKQELNRFRSCMLNLCKLKYELHISHVAGNTQILLTLST